MSITQSLEANHLVFNTKAEAELVLKTLSEVIDKYNYATVSDLKDIVGIPTRYIETKHGWTATKNFQIHELTAGVALHIPEVENVDSTIPEIRATKDQTRKLLMKIAKNMKEDGLTNVQIAMYLDIDESDIQPLLAS